MAEYDLDGLQYSYGNHPNGWVLWHECWSVKTGAPHYYRYNDDPTPRTQPRYPEPSRKPVMYVAHPVSGAPIDNCFRTIRWIKALTDMDPTRIYVAPWIGEVMAYPGKAGETHHRPWDVALRDDEEVLSRFDGIVMVGGRISDGMQREWNHARKLHKTCVDMSRFALPENLPEGFELEPAE